MKLVFWTPMKNTERTAIARFGSTWQFVGGSDTAPIVNVGGRACQLIHPVGHAFEARWVPIEQIMAEDAP